MAILVTVTIDVARLKCKGRNPEFVVADILRTVAYRFHLPNPLQPLKEPEPIPQLYPEPGDYPCGQLEVEEYK